MPLPPNIDLSLLLPRPWVFQLDEGRPPSQSFPPSWALLFQVKSREGFWVISLLW